MQPIWSQQSQNHSQNQFKKQPQQKPRQCYSCHKSSDIHQQRNGKKCQDCHNEKSWRKAQFDHDKNTDYPLVGKHQKVSCAACHGGQARDQQPGSNCIDCHAWSDPHEKSLGRSCENCHNSNGWNDTVFSHDVTDFALIGLHRQLDCKQCHLTAKYEETPSACYDCHKRKDVHKGAMKKDCGLCHNPNDWSMWLFDHDRQTRYALKGAHRELHCELCHRNAEPLSNQCYDCHRDDDAHHGRFGTRCQQCHNEKSFDKEGGLK